MATQEDKDVKPAETLTLGVKDPAGDVIHFKIKKTTKFEKIIQAYAQRKGMSADAFRLVLDGKRLNKFDSPENLGLVDGDTVDALFEQTGGCC